MTTPDINQTLIINNMLTPHVYGDSLFFYVYIQLSTYLLIILLTVTLTYLIISVISGFNVRETRAGFLQL